MKTEDLTFPVRKLAERAHIDIVESGGRGASSSKKARLKEICKLTAGSTSLAVYQSAPDAAAARSYLRDAVWADRFRRNGSSDSRPKGALVRHLSGLLRFGAEEMIEANVATRGSGLSLRDRFFNRVMFPIHDAQGDCIAFGGRVIGKGEPKYLNSQETPVSTSPQVLYGLDKAKASMALTGDAVVVEATPDVIALHEGGIENVVATLGTALSCAISAFCPVTRRSASCIFSTAMRPGSAPPIARCSSSTTR